jgi:homoserine dehydrogenase
MRIGIVGLGGVGRAFLSLLDEKKDELEDRGINPHVIFALNSTSGCKNQGGISITEILGHLSKSRELTTFEGGFAGGDMKKLLDESQIDLLIEATPTNKVTGEPAMSHISYALERGIHVVTANKGPIMLNYKGLRETGEKAGARLGIGCTAGGALPTISSGNYDLLGAKILGIRGVLNGTTNYILTLMEEESMDYTSALEQAQREGIAETNPAMDVEGWDTAIKLIIISNALMGTNIKLEDTAVTGIEKISLGDIEKASAEGKKIKLLGQLKVEDGIYSISVIPTAIGKDDIFFGVNGKNKGIQYITDTMGEVAVLGGASNLKGAAASILRDVLQIWTH